MTRPPRLEERRRRVSKDVPGGGAVGRILDRPSTRPLAPPAQDEVEAGMPHVHTLLRAASLARSALHCARCIGGGSLAALSGGRQSGAPALTSDATILSLS